MPYAWLAIGVVVRLVWVLAIPSRPVGDFAMYWESAAHLLAFGELDPGYAYMPGYVLLLAAVQAAGGGVLAAKIVGVAFAGLAGLAVAGLTLKLVGRRAATVAAALHAVWPGGVAMSGVIGTDVPAAALIVCAAWWLVSQADRRPALAAAGFGALIGIATLLRAVALPLAVLAAPYLLARGAPWRASAVRGVIAVATALVLLVPWAIRNLHRHDALFFTDAHGGITAVLGANPNLDAGFPQATYELFTAGTGHPVLSGDHRAADRAAYALAMDLARFEPAYALGAAIGRAERLFEREHALLYWPLFRPGALPPAWQRWLDGTGAPVRFAADLFGFVLLAGFVVGILSLLRDRRWASLALLLMPAALAGAYVLFFGEARYRIPIQLLVWPVAAHGLCAAARMPGASAARRVAIGLALMAAVWLPWRATLALGTTLRDRHRWAALVCEAAGRPRLCLFRRADPASGPSPLRGHAREVTIMPAPGGASVELQLWGAPLAPGEYVVRAGARAWPVVHPGGRLRLIITTARPLSLAGVAVHFSDEKRRGVAPHSHARAIPGAAAEGHRAGVLGTVLGLPR